MSGIVGIVHVGGAPVDDTMLRRMTDALAFRGPEGSHVWVSGQVGFGHTLMRVFDDIDDDRQPCTVGGDVWITADARIDDQATLITALARGGRVVSKGTTDAQLILHAYHVWGEDCVTHLLGDYAFAIWDGPRQLLYCARDPFGVKLFYYAKLGDVFVFSNTLDVVRQHPRVGDALNERAIGDFLLVGCNAELDTTFFADVQRVPPANWMVLDASSGALTQRRYWNFPVPEPLRYRRDEEYTEHFRELLRMAISDRLRTKTVGFYFSGGLDSTTIAAMAKEVFERRGQVSGIFGITRVGNSLRPDDEGHYATLAAKMLGMPLELVDFEGFRYFDRIAEARNRRPEPVDDPEVALATDFAQLLANRSRVAFIGEDGDALLSPTSMLTLLRTGPRLPLLLDVVRYFIRRRRLPFVGMHLRYRLTRQFGAPAEYPDWFTPDFEAAFGLLDRSRELSHPRPFSFHAMRPMSCRYYTSVAWQPFLESLDAGVTGLRQDVRLPFIDLRMLEFAFAIPSVPWCEQKELLRSGMQGRLPTAVLARRKAPAAALDPAALHNIAGSAVESWAPPTELANYVMIQRIRRSGVRPSAEMAWLDFRPRLLGTWLQARGKLSNTLLSEGA